MSDSAKTVHRPEIVSLPLPNRARRDSSSILIFRRAAWWSREGPGAGGANGIHTEVRDLPVTDDNQFAILPADFDDGLYFRYRMDGGDRLAGNFIFY